MSESEQTRFKCIQKQTQIHKQHRKGSIVYNVL